MIRPESLSKICVRCKLKIIYIKVKLCIHTSHLEDITRPPNEIEVLIMRRIVPLSLHISTQRSKNNICAYRGAGE